MPAKLLFDDDFSRGWQKNWENYVYNPDHYFGRTWWGGVPVVRPQAKTGEPTHVRLNLHTYHTHHVRAFKGTEIYGKRYFSLSGTKGEYIEFEATIRILRPRKGAVYAFYSYGPQDDPNTGDEIDFEFLGNLHPQRLLWLNIFNGDKDKPSNRGRRRVLRPTFKPRWGGNWRSWNVYRFRWYRNKVEWHIGNTVFGPRTSIVPDEPMRIHLNVWAPTDTSVLGQPGYQVEDYPGNFPQGFHASYKPTRAESPTQTTYMDIRRVRVTRVTP